METKKLTVNEALKKAIEMKIPRRRGASPTRSNPKALCAVEACCKVVGLNPTANIPGHVSNYNGFEAYFNVPARELYYKNDRGISWEELSTLEFPKIK